MTLLATDRAPIPQGAHWEWLTAADGTRLRVARFAPAHATRGTVVLLNGRTEFIEKYFEVIDDLMARGFAVATLDWRGQGLSDRSLPNPHKGHVASFSLYIDDLQQVMESFVRPTCPGPYVLLSHSMGGNISLRYLAQAENVFQAAYFSAPMWGVGKNERPSAGTKLMATIACGLGLSSRYLPGAGGDFGPEESSFEGNVLTSDRERFERCMAQITAEPRLALGAPTLGWAKQALASIESLHAAGFAEAIATPIRVCSAGSDALVSQASHEAICRRLPNAKNVLVEGAQHELLVEADVHRDHSFDAFDELLDEAKI